jgi:hypothetical protein
MPVQLSRSAYQKARAFVEGGGRALDAALLRFTFDGGAASAVLEALAPYQTSDGGFAYGLEPDLPTPAATAIVTSLGLQILRQVGAAADVPMVRRAVAWLAGAFDADKGVWPIINAQVNLTPHAFWWGWDDDLATRWNHFAFNPSAEVLAHLYAYRAVAPEAVIGRAEAALMAAMTKTERLEGAYDVKALMRLVETDAAPAAVHAAAEDLITRTRAAFDPNDPHASALDLQPRPTGGSAGTVGAEIEAALAQIVAAQEPDGGWRPFWDWSAVDAEAWRAAEAAWRGVLTRQALETLEAYGRIAAG